MTAPILVTGGTGTLGRLVVSRLRVAGHAVRVLGRHSPEDQDGIEFLAGDLATGEGIPAAVEGIEVIMHLAGGQKGDEVKTANLVEAASRAEVKHMVYISVVGADRIPMASGIDRAMFGYFGSKLASEQAVIGSGIPWTTLRATQFHELTFKTAQQMAKLPVVPVPSGFQFQPIAAEEVAERLVELALGTPAGLGPDIAGPRVYEMSDLIRGYVRSNGKRRLILPIRLPGKAARAFRDGANLAPDHAVGRLTWEEFLAAHVGSRNDTNSRKSRLSDAGA